MMWWVKEERYNGKAWVVWDDKYKGPYETKEETYVPVGLAESFNNPYVRYEAWEEKLI